MVTLPYKAMLPPTMETKIPSQRAGKFVPGLDSACVGSVNVIPNTGTYYPASIRSQKVSKEAFLMNLLRHM